MIVLGLDLSAIRWGAFSHKEMFDRRFHLRRNRLIVYQLAMILLVIGESVGTAALSKYLDLQSHIEKQVPGVSLYQNDIVGVASFTIFAGVLTASILGALFFFHLFWPALPESRFWAHLKFGAVTFCNAAVLGACISSTIIGTRKSAHYEFADGVNPIQGRASVEAAGLTYPPLKYAKYSYVIVWLVFFWVGWLFVVWSNFLVWKASQYHLDHPEAAQRYVTYDRENRTGQRSGESAEKLPTRH